jgi:hypothetical protein
MAIVLELTPGKQTQKIPVFVFIWPAIRKLTN